MLLRPFFVGGGVARKKYFPRDENLFSSARTDFFLGRFFLYSFPIKSFPKANILTSNCPLVITNFKNSLTSGFLLFLPLRDRDFGQGAKDTCPHVKMSGRNAIEWPTLDVDLEIDSLKHPERYPLIMKRNEMEVL